MAGLYVDRREAIDYAARKQGNTPKALELLKTALKDRYYGLRIVALQRLNLGNDSVKNSVEPLLLDMANSDPKSLVRAGAIEALGKYKKNTYKALFLKSVNDSSYAIAGNALIALGALDSVAALDNAKSLSAQHVKGALSDAINNLLFMYDNENDFDSLSGRFDKMPLGYPKFMILQPFADFLKRVKNTANFEKGIDMIASFRDSIPEAYRHQVLSFIDGMILYGIESDKRSSGLTEQADYVKSKMSGNSKALALIEVPMETLQKYTGEYSSEQGIFQIVVKDGKTLHLLITGGPDMELVPASKDKFSVNYMEGFSVKFTLNAEDEVTEMLLESPGGQVKASRKK